MLPTRGPARSHAIPRHNHNVPAHPHFASIKSPANQLSSLFCIDREMKYSPVLTNPILPLSSRGSPESSNRSSLRGLIAIHAVTLACTAAFAAGSVALLCMFIVSGQTNSGGRLLGLPPPSDWPQNSMEYDRRGTSSHFKATNVVKVYEATGASNQYGRRALRPNFPTVGGDSDHVDAVWPTGAVWLMSFPNSGTSYTLHSIRELTNTTTATNYGLEGDIKDKDSVPVFKGDVGINGPYLELIPNRTTSLPKLILTKTHCGGFSTSLDPNKYIETPRSFLMACLSGVRGVRSSTDPKTMEKLPVRYSQDLVKRVVHIIRNPLDNIVARFHLEQTRFTSLKNETWLNQFPDNKQGFQKWCKSMDDDKELATKSHWIDTGLVDAFDGVPCRADFFRYVQWHNLAFTVALVDLDVPALVFHYEDYSTRFADVTQELMDFLELKPIAEAPEFISNKAYGDYYSAEQTQAIAKFIDVFSSELTRKHMERYFDAGAAATPGVMKAVGRS